MFSVDYISVRKKGEVGEIQAIYIKYLLRVVSRVDMALYKVAIHNDRVHRSNLSLLYANKTGDRIIGTLNIKIKNLGVRPKDGSI